MRVEMWPSTKSSTPDCFVTVTLSPETVDYLMNQSCGVMSSWASSTQVTDANGAFRFRVRSPVMLLTVCQGQLKRRPDLKQMVVLLKGAADLCWDIRIPADGWEDDDPEPWALIDEIREIKEEIPA